MDVIAALRDEAAHALRGERRENASGASAPIVADMRRPLDIERVHELEQIMGKCGLLTRARRFVFAKASSAVAAQVRHDGSIARLDEPRHHAVEWARILGKAVPKKYGLGFSWPAVFVGDLERVRARVF